MKPYFVMLYTSADVGYVPMIDGDDNDLAMYDTEDEARSAAQNTSLGEAFGYEIFQMGEGVI